MDAKQISKLKRVALGEDFADLQIINANVVNVYTREILQSYQVGTSGERIAYVTSEEMPAGPQT
ncbi:MAG: adenosine deaminase, partial [Bacillota bacterium]